MISIQLSETVVAGLSAQAAAQGMTLEAYLESLVGAVPLERPHRLSIEEFDRLLDEEASIGPSPSGTFSRAELYADHD
jgi:hypothetical protein